jgi:hypothetical protein
MVDETATREDSTDSSGQAPSRVLGNLAASPLPGVQDSILALISEVQLLLDFVSGLPAHSLRDLEIGNLELPQEPGAAAPPHSLKAGAVVMGVEHLVDQLKRGTDLSPADITFLRLTKDALVHMTAPATGMSIAYTTMVLGTRKNLFRMARAAQAYPGLVNAARFHHFGHIFMMALALVITTISVSESARVALGKALLQTRQELRTQQAAISAEKLELEQKNGNSSEWNVALSEPDGPEISHGKLGLDYCQYALSFANRYGSQAWWPKDADNKPLPAYFTPKSQEVCGRDTILAQKFALSHADLQQFYTDWPRIVGFPFNVLTFVESAVKGLENSPKGVSADLEWRIAPVLLVIGNYALPMFFAALGAAAFVVLDFYDKVRSSTLTPRDHVLGWIRLTLGLVVGASIGLLFSSYGPTAVATDQGLIGALTLSASAIAFLAGFGVEGVFGLLNTLVKRVFAASPETTAPKAASAST